MKAGVQDYLYKGDIEPETLRRSVLYAMERKRAQLAHEALHDPLTGLPNRTLFRDRCLQALAGIGRTTSGIGVLFIDLDGFKQVNDSLGHAAGDQPARGGRPTVSGSRCGRATRSPASAVTSSRCSGRRSTTATMPSQLAQRVDEGARGAFHGRRGARSSLTCSIGIAFTFERERGSRRADPRRRPRDVPRKGARRRLLRGLRQSLRARTTKRRELEAELRTALERGPAARRLPAAGRAGHAGG